MQYNGPAPLTAFPRLVPSNWNCTLAIATSSVAYAETVIVPLTSAPSMGAVIDTVGGAVSGTSDGPESDDGNFIKPLITWQFQILLNQRCLLKSVEVDWGLWNLGALAYDRIIHIFGFQSPIDFVRPRTRALRHRQIVESQYWESAVDQ
jgi:hypothetical protein